MTDLLWKYIADHSEPEPEFLIQLTRQTHLQLLNPRMLSGHVQGRILKQLVRMIRPRRVLEIGTYTGYSAHCMAEALLPDSHLDTIEINDELAPFLEKNFSTSPLRNKISFFFGDAMEVIPTLQHQYDLVFMDGDKRLYSDYYHALFDMIPSGGYILADNVLWDGHVVDQVVKNNDYQTKGIVAFNEMIKKDKRVEPVILPLRDGISLIYKL